MGSRGRGRWYVGQSDESGSGKPATSDAETPSAQQSENIASLVMAHLSICHREREREIERERERERELSLIHISEPTRPTRISYAVFCV